MLSLAIPLIQCASFMAAESIEGGPAHQELDRLVEKIISAESSGRSWISGDRGRSRGLMQIQRANWQRYTTESWDRAFEPALNRKVGTSMVREIIKRYGTRANEALVVYTYNTGKFCSGDLPEWTKRHPNDIYRGIFNGAVISIRSTEPQPSPKKASPARDANSPVQKRERSTQDNADPMGRSVVHEGDHPSVSR